MVSLQVTMMTVLADFPEAKAAVLMALAGVGNGPQCFQPAARGQCSRHLTHSAAYPPTSSHKNTPSRASHWPSHKSGVWVRTDWVLLMPRSASGFDAVAACDCVGLSVLGAPLPLSTIF